MKKETPKHILLTNAICSHLDSEMEIEDESGLTRLSKEIELGEGNMHKDTLTKELERGFILGEILIKNFDPTWEKGRLKKIKKIKKTNEIQEIWKSIAKINEKQDDIIKLLKRK